MPDGPVPSTKDNEKHSLTHPTPLINSPAFSRVTMETEYGLIVEIGPTGSILAKLRPGVALS